MNGYSQELWSFMEECYRKHGASSNGAQLNIRGDKLRDRVEKYGEEKVRWMLENDFDMYHYDKPCKIDSFKREYEIVSPDDYHPEMRYQNE